MSKNLLTMPPKSNIIDFYIRKFAFIKVTKKDVRLDDHRHLPNCLYFLFYLRRINIGSLVPAAFYCSLLAFWQRSLVTNNPQSDQQEAFRDQKKSSEDSWIRTRDLRVGIQCTNHWANPFRLFIFKKEERLNQAQKFINSNLSDCLFNRNGYSKIKIEKHRSNLKNYKGINPIWKLFCN